MENLQNQEIFIIIATGVAAMLGMALTLIAFYGRSQRKLLSQRLEAQDRILQETIMAQEEERNRIAKELHDDIGSKLNVAFLHVQRLQKEVPPESIEIINEVINKSIDSTRRISHELLPPTLEKFGLWVALHELCEGYEKTGLVDVDLEIDDLQGMDLDSSQKLNLFRILQELVKNSINHGEAKNLSIHFKDEAPHLKFLYADDGKGFDKDKVGKGLGMSNIESRLKIIDGQWLYDSAPGKGMKAEIVVDKAA